jgi:phosphate transport system protein
MRTRFQLGLDELKTKLLTMAGMAEQAVDRAADAYRDRNLRLCEAVLQAEPAINRAEREIDELAIDLLAMQQPMAVDLRFVTSAMKINADLERVGDQAVNIVERVIHMVSLPETELPVDIPKLAAAASSMIRHSVESLVQQKEELAAAVLRMDDVVDRMNDENYIILTEKMHQQPDCIPQAMDALLVSRNLERIGDHATNIAEDVIFWLRGADVRHHALDVYAAQGGGQR